MPTSVRASSCAATDAGRDVSADPPGATGSALDERRQAAHALIAEHLEQVVAAEPWVQTVEYDPELTRWYVRFGCDGRDATTIYFDLHQRTLRYEVYFLPDPPARHLDLYRYALVHNHALYGAKFSVGHDGDLYLVGRVALEHLTVEELDRIIGVLYETVDRCFPPAVRMAFGSRATPDRDARDPGSG